MLKWKSKVAVPLAAGVLCSGLAFVFLIGHEPVRKTPPVADPSPYPGVRGPAGQSPFAAVPSFNGVAAPDSPTWLQPRLGQDLSGNPASILRIAPPHFKLNRDGTLKLDADARNGIEQLLASGSAEEVRSQLEQASQGLPEAAAHQLRDVVVHFQQYDAAVSQALPPGREPANPQEVQDMLDRLHALRVEHLGADTAQALFGEEERASLQLIELMKVQNDASLTLEQKAEHAQEAYKKMSAPSTSERR